MATGANQTLVQFDCAIQRAQLDKARAVLSGSEKSYGANKRLAGRIVDVAVNLSHCNLLRSQGRSERSGHKPHCAACGQEIPAWH